MEEESLVEERAQYSATLEPNSRALRDAYLKAFSSSYKIGRLFSESGGVLWEGRTSVEWMQFFKIVEYKDLKNLTVEQLQGLFLRLAQGYHQAGSFHATLFAAAEDLEIRIDKEEGSFLQTELAKYQIGRAHV